MSLGNWIEPSGLVSTRLDATISDQEKLDARVTTLIQILAERGVLTQDDLARIADAATAAERNKT